MKLGTLFIIGVFGFGFLERDCGNANKADRSSANNQNSLVASTSPTPASPDKSKKQKPSPTPTADCLPPFVSEQSKNDPDYRTPSAEELGLNDSDCDGICDRADNCIIVYNPDQKDRNGDGHGDACDPKLVDKSFRDLRCDMDGDGVPDFKDNCPWVCNPDQRFVDVNKNGVNDLCDNALPDSSKGQTPCPKREKVRVTEPINSRIKSPEPTPLSTKEKNNPIVERTSENVLNTILGTPDWDCDGIYNSKDNCIFVYNPNQTDSDGDGKGDSCNPKLVDPSYEDSRCDRDRDGIPDFRDNCLLACNPAQKDENKNGIGDICDPAFSDAVLGQRICTRSRKLKPPKPRTTVFAFSKSASPLPMWTRL
ncbi:MAG: thrombospondin type 3 repeat-containing protein [Pyrinomonadaceae bacterium]